jgi:hypothetical protein
MPTDTTNLLVGNDDEDFKKYLYEASGQPGDELSELDKYMAHAPLRISGQFDILEWWKKQIDEYHVMSQIANQIDEYHVLSQIAKKLMVV